jgi:hypothetical protein
VVQGPPLPYRPFVRREHLPACVVDAQPARRLRSSAVGFSALIPGFPDGEGFSVIVAWTALSPRGDSRVSFSKRRQHLTSNSPSHRSRRRVHLCPGAGPGLKTGRTCLCKLSGNLYRFRPLNGPPRARRVRPTMVRFGTQHQPDAQDSRPM